MATRSKLAVILHADVVGSTALVQKNESVAHERIQDVSDACLRRFNLAPERHMEFVVMLVSPAFNRTLSHDIEPRRMFKPLLPGGDQPALVRSSSLASATLAWCGHRHGNVAREIGR